MKTPREILLQHHAAAKPRLDAIRHAAMQTENQLVASPNNWAACIASLPRTLCLELVWPVRRVWIGLAVTWLALVLINTQLRELKVTMIAGGNTTPSPSGITLAERNQLLAELIPVADAPAAEPPKRSVPRPHSEVMFQTITV